MLPACTCAGFPFCGQPDLHGRNWGPGRWSRFIGWPNQVCVINENQRGGERELGCVQGDGKGQRRGAKFLEYKSIFRLMVQWTKWKEQKLYKKCRNQMQLKAERERIDGKRKWERHKRNLNYIMHWQPLHVMNICKKPGYVISGPEGAIKQSEFHRINNLMQSHWANSKLERNQYYQWVNRHLKATLHGQFSSYSTE